MSLFVDTSVWSLALRRDGASAEPLVLLLSDALAQGRDVLTTGLVVQELLQGFTGPKARKAIIDRFRHLPMLVPTREDHVQAAELRNRCRRKGVQVGTIDALIAQLCLRYELALLTTDHDFAHMAQIIPIQLARP
ncbi:MAG: VapC toxin family PIN domain ribonuclease [Deltaproteobacteria bacterium]|nr:MAG: VapC toxin family PIN domain ribonuclease [Deltaproteobacteria bacterium]